AEARVAAALEKAEDIRAKAEEQAAQTIADATATADRMIRDAKQGSELLRSETSAKVDREQRAAKRELDELNQQRESITAYLDELRGLLGEGDDSAVSALTSTPLAPAGAEPGAIEEEPSQDGDSLAESAAADAAVEAEAGVVEPT